jgi:hypothetical protein
MKPTMELALPPFQESYITSNTRQSYILHSTKTYKDSFQYGVRQLFRRKQIPESNIPKEIHTIISNLDRVIYNIRQCKNTVDDKATLLNYIQQAKNLIHDAVKLQLDVQLTNSNDKLSLLNIFLKEYLLDYLLTRGFQTANTNNKELDEQNAQYAKRSYSSFVNYYCEIVYLEVSALANNSLTTTEQQLQQNQLRYATNEQKNLIQGIIKNSNSEDEIIYKLTELQSKKI